MNSWMLHLWCSLNAMTAALLCNSFLINSTLRMSHRLHEIAH